MGATMRSAVVVLSIALLAAGSACRGGVAGPSPTIVRVSPDSGPVGTTLTITGSGFGRTGNAVQVGVGYVLDLASADGVTITFVLPEAMGVCPPSPGGACVALAVILSPGRYDLAVITPSGTSNRLPFTVLAR